MHMVAAQHYICSFFYCKWESAEYVHQSWITGLDNKYGLLWRISNVINTLKLESAHDFLP